MQSDSQMSYTHRRRLTQITCTMLGNLCIHKLDGDYLESLANLSESDCSHCDSD